MARGTCWFIEGRAYDLTPFLDTHPGGGRVLRQSIGVDATHLFRTYHALSDIEAIRRRMRQYEVPAEGDPSALRCPRGGEDRRDPLYPELCAEVKAYFRSRKLSHKCPPWLYPWYVLWLVVSAWGLKGWVERGSSPAIAAVSLGTWFLFGDLLHSGTHFAMFRSRRLNSLLAYALGHFFCNPVVWIRQHVVGHHVDTNLQTDPDLHHSTWASHAAPLRRLGRIPFYLMIPTALVPGLFTHPPRMLLSRDKYYHLPTAPVGGGGERALMVLYWAFAALLHSTVLLRHGILVAAAPPALTSALFYMFSQVSHVNAASSPGTHDPATPWSVRQIASCRGDYATRSRLLWPLLSNGLNQQTVHHLFPTVHWIWYPGLVDNILRLAGEPPTHREQTLAGSFLRHVSYATGMTGGSA